MFPSLWVTALLPSAKEAIKFHLNPGESQASASGHPCRLPAEAGRRRVLVSCHALTSLGWPGQASALVVSAEFPWTPFRDFFG